jgi:hypothetical protein
MSTRATIDLSMRVSKTAHIMPRIRRVFWRAALKATKVNRIGEQEEAI